MTQSSELAGGDGFTFEGDAAAFYLSSLLAETYAPGIKDRVVVGVSVQQRDFGEPLDDVVVDFAEINNNESKARLSLQVKRKLTISKAATNTDFIEIIRDSWATLKKNDFRKGTDRYGAAVGTISATKLRELNTLCDLARESQTVAHFETRFSVQGNANKKLATLKDDIAELLESANGRKCRPEEVHQFFAHFVLVQFDFLHEGATNSPEAISLIKNSLASEDCSKAPLVWSKLVSLARASAGKAGQFDRARLVRELDAVARLRGAISLRQDIDKLTELAKSYVSFIPDDVGGTKLSRDILINQLDDKFQRARIIQVTGLPGSGKSVLIRRVVERAINLGPTIFLKAEQLEGTSWLNFANLHGIKSTSIEKLLVEIGATGTSVLFIDAIDRIDKDRQGIILDLLRTIKESALLDKWHIVTSLRDNGIEVLRNWLSEYLDDLIVETINVGQLSDEESAELAKEKPHLRPLLFGTTEVKGIVRRPFFAKVLNQSFQANNKNQTFIPQSEVDLIEHWWKLGGYNEQGQNAFERQQILLDLARVRSRQLSQPIKLSQLSSIRHIDSLISDGVLQNARQGISIHFAHDIFFEWAFFHVLGDKGDHWVEEIKYCGEPPAIARVVELVSQWEYLKGENWSKYLSLTIDPSLRSQWQRAWLLGPFGSTNFGEKEDQFEHEAFANDFQFLKKALVWFQAEKTSPNLNVLQSDLPAVERQRYADLLGWPSDYSSWRRFIVFILKRITKIPQYLYPQIVAIFEVWQNALSELENSISITLLQQCATWLTDLDALKRLEKPNDKSAYWDEVSDLRDFRKSIVRLLLKASKLHPIYAQEYMQRCISAKRIRDEEFSDIISFAPLIAQSIPDVLVQLTIAHLCQELPEDQVAREEQEQQDQIKWRETVLAKPESERTEDERRSLDFVSPFHLSSDFSSYDWQRLCILDDHKSFYPASPLREPFLSLFQYSPENALKLLKELCNHAVNAWRQLHYYSYDRDGTPLPLELSFPWGAQKFWGGDHEYLWFRSMLAPNVIGSGFMALEEWCLGEVEKDRSVDELIQQVIEGNESVAILGTASMLAAYSATISEVTFPLVSSQRLLSADRNRLLREHQSSANLMGFLNKSDTVHVKAIKEANSRPVRNIDLQWLVKNSFYSGDPISERLKVAILNFKDNLPFLYKEHQEDQKTIHYLAKQAQELSELVDINNYQAYKIKDEPDTMVVIHEGPSTKKPENIAKAKAATEYLQIADLWAWASKFFDEKSLSDKFTIVEALSVAQNADKENLFSNSFDPSTVDGLEMRRGAISAAAAVALNFKEDCSEDDISWARGVLKRAIQVVERLDAMWSPESAIPWHQGIFVARGIGADLRDGAADDNSFIDLLNLIAHPLEVVSLAAIEEACKLWCMHPKLTWASLTLAFSLCTLPRRGRRSQSDAEYDPQPVFETALDYFNSGFGWPIFPLPPEAWVKIRSDDERYKYRSYGEYERFDVNDESDYWVEPDEYWKSRTAAKILNLIPYNEILRSGAKEALLSFLESVLNWTIQKNAPPWIKTGRRNRSATEHLEWTHILGNRLGIVCGLLSLHEVQPRFLDPILNLEDDNCWGMLSSFSNAYVCAYIYDAKVVPEDAVTVLDLIIERFLNSSVFRRKSYRSGELNGFDEPELVKTLMFVSVERADLAARYVNGDWSEIELIMPIVDKFVRKAGWAASVMTHFLTLCERARESFPAESYADQVLCVINEGPENLKGWNGTFLSARIAELVQHFSHRDTPMSQGLAQKLLKILDILVDMGDRRSAALQLGEEFREVRVSG